jgi:hypothetical protein
LAFAFSGAGNPELAEEDLRQAELAKLGIQVSDSTIRKYRRRRNKSAEPIGISQPMTST